jgi:tetratricopeptide (TPR) repeat protein
MTRWVNTCNLFLVSMLVLFSHNLPAQHYHSTDSLLKVYNSAAHDTDRINALIFLGWNMCSNDLSKSMEYASKAMDQARVLKHNRLMGDAFLLKANYHYLKNEYERAVEYNLLAIKEYEKDDYKTGMTFVYNNLGVVYEKMERLEDALRCHQKSLRFRENTDERSNSYSLSNIGIIYSKMRKYGQAEKTLNEALRIEKKYGDMRGAAETMLSLGNVAKNTNRLIYAKNLFDRALFIFDSLDDQNYKRRCLGAIATMYYESDEVKKAAEYALKARSMINGVSPSHELENVYIIMIEFAKEKNDHELAIIYYDSLFMLTQKLYSEKVAQQSAELLKKYESEKKDKENATLKEEKIQAQMEASRRNAFMVFSLVGVIFIAVLAILYMRQKRLKETQRNTELEQKVLRAQMNPHFIFNALNAIQRLYLEKKQEKADEYMGDFGQLLRKILDNSGKSLITLHEELMSLNLYLNLEKNRLEEKMDYEIVGHEELDTHHILVPPLILQPVIENAIWHGIAPKGKGKIRISCSRLNNKLLEFIIEDDGVGIQSKNGSGNHLHVSKGLKLTEERLKPLGSIILLTGTDNIGTKVIMDIPYKIG